MNRSRTVSWRTSLKEASEQLSTLKLVLVSHSRRETVRKRRKVQVTLHACEAQARTLPSSPILSLLMLSPLMHQDVHETACTAPRMQMSMHRHNMGSTHLCMLISCHLRQTPQQRVRRQQNLLLLGALLFMRSKQCRASNSRPVRLTAQRKRLQRGALSKRRLWRVSRGSQEAKRIAHLCPLQMAALEVPKPWTLVSSSQRLMSSQAIKCAANLALLMRHVLKVCKLQLTSSSVVRRPVSLSCLRHIGLLVGKRQRASSRQAMKPVLCRLCQYWAHHRRNNRRLRLTQHHQQRKRLHVRLAQPHHCHSHQCLRLTQYHQQRTRLHVRLA